MKQQHRILLKSLTKHEMRVETPSATVSIHRGRLASPDEDLVRKIMLASALRKVVEISGRPIVSNIDSEDPCQVLAAIVSAAGDWTLIEGPEAVWGLEN